jgi:hypothetical protein
MALHVQPLVSYMSSIMTPIVRRNVRVGLGVGKDDVTHLVGDFLMVWYVPAAYSNQTKPNPGDTHPYGGRTAAAVSAAWVRC